MPKRGKVYDATTVPGWTLVRDFGRLAITPDPNDPRRYVATLIPPYGPARQVAPRRKP